MYLRSKLGLLILLVLLLPPTPRAALAQPTRVDSLWAQMRLPNRPDSFRVKVLQRLEYELIDVYPDSAERIAQQALALSKRAGFAFGQIQSLNALAMGANRRSDSQAAMRYLTQAIAVARTTGERRDVSLTYDRLADVAFAQQDFLRAVQFAKASLAAATAERRRAPVGALSSLMSAYLELGRVAEARQMFQQLQRQSHYDPTFDNDQIEFQTIAAWANGIRRFAPDTAVIYGERALWMANRLRNPPAQAYARMSLIQTYAALKRWPAIVQLAPETLTLLRRYPNPGFEAEVQLAYGDALHHLRPTDPAGYRATRRALVLNDTLYGQEQSDALAAAQVKFDVAGQQARIRSLEQQRRIQRLETDRQTARTRLLLAVAAGLAALLGAAAFFYRRLQRSRAALARSETQLRQANATKDQLMAIVGHDLRGPAAALRVVAPLLREQGVGAPPNRHQSPEKLAASAEETDQILTALDASSQQMSTLLDTLLHWAREQTGSLLIRPRPLTVSALLAEATAPYQAQAALLGIRLECTSTAALTLHADPDLLLTVLRNLVANAVKFSPRNGVVRVSAEPRPGGTHAAGVLIVVRDEGPGLDAARAARLLSVVAEATTESTPGARGESGTGLGLPLSARFARLLGGELCLLPAPAGGGSAVGCWVPCAPPTAAAVATRRAARRGAATAS